MRKPFIVLLITFLVASGFLFFLAAPRRKAAVLEGEQTHAQATPTPEPKPAGLRVGAYEVHMQEVDPIGLTLIPNFDEQKTTSQIMEEHHCAYGVNGGFFVPGRKPLGLFIANNQKRSEAVVSSAATTFITKDFGADKSIFIEDTSPTHDVFFAVQAGPSFSLPQETPMNFVNDEHSRRVLLATTTKHVPYFLVVTDPENVYNGPSLTEIPSIIKKLPIEFSQVVNLDGGTASAFYSADSTKFEELVAVGSFFCVQGNK